MSQLIRPYVASGAIARRRIVAFGASNNLVVQASASTDAMIGVIVDPVDVVDGEPVSICLLGECYLEVTGAVTRGALLTADANGKGVPAAPGSGVNARTIGIAQINGTNTTIRVMVLPGMVQGA